MVENYLNSTGMQTYCNSVTGPARNVRIYECVFVTRVSHETKEVNNEPIRNEIDNVWTKPPGVFLNTISKRA